MIFDPGQSPRFSWKNDNQASALEYTLFYSTFHADSESTIFIAKCPDISEEKLVLLAEFHVLVVQHHR